jgi:hypothetical protein
MATLNIPNTPQYTTLINMIEEILNPNAKSMREFQEKLNDSELALVFSAINTANSKKSAKTAASKTHPKAPRNQTKAADDDVRCEALVFAYEMNADGQLVPSRCKRCIEENTKFCKQHGAADGKPWKCKERGNVETTHEFKWQHLGTVNEPSPIFDLEKAKAELLKNFNAKQLSMEAAGKIDCADVQTTHATLNKVPKPLKQEKEPKEKKTTKKQLEDKPKKRGANGYIFYKSLKHQEIKQQLMSEYPEMKGKELANKITSVASEQWNLLSEADQAQYKKQAQAQIAETTELSSSVVEHIDDCDTPMVVEATPKAVHETSPDEMNSFEIPTVDSEDEEAEEDTLVFNEKHKVWVDTDNNLCYESKDTNPGPIGQVQRGQFLRFPTAKK